MLVMDMLMSLEKAVVYGGLHMDENKLCDELNAMMTVYEVART
jgi:hypothetical protein